MSLLLAGCTDGQAPDEQAPSGSAPTSTASETADASPSPTDGSTTDPGTDDPDEGTPTPTPSATEDEEGEPFPANTRPDTAEPTHVGETLLSVTDIRIGLHDGYDRVVFDLEGTGDGQPGWRVEYVDQAVDDGSGHPVEVDGDAILRVSLSGTANPMDSGVEGYSRDRLDASVTEVVDEIVYRYWFEGYTTAFIGLDGGERPFRAFLLEDPTRVVVDVQH